MTKFLRDNRWFPLLRDIIIALLIVAVLMSVVYAYSGSVTPLVAVESGSMTPHIDIGDVVLVKRPADIVTYQEGKVDNYQSFSNYGDVIVYRPNGDQKMTPIIHRAMYWVNAGDRLPNGQKAGHAGYITKGDNNVDYDQPLLFGGTPPIQPVKPEWIIGIAIARVPGLGYFRLALPTVVDPLLTAPDIYRGQMVSAALPSVPSLPSASFY